MKKLNNKGFSLVELIIVIAIMAVLAGALAPALITYIEKSRISTDKQTADTIRSAIQAALADDTVYDDTIADNASADVSGHYKPGSATGAGLDIAGLTSAGLLKNQVNENVKPDSVKIKSKKAWQSASDGFIVKITPDGEVRVYLKYVNDADKAKKYGATANACSDTMKVESGSSTTPTT